MTTRDQIIKALEKKQEIDQHNAQAAGMGSMSYESWMVEAMELLLRIAVEQLQASGKP